MRTRIRINGMSCNHCVKAVYTALTPVEGVTGVQLGIGWAEIEHDGRVTVDQLREAIAVAGYEVAEEKPQTGRRVLPLL
jgi:copper chaperone CopZ